MDYPHTLEEMQEADATHSKLGFCEKGRECKRESIASLMSSSRYHSLRHQEHKAVREYSYLKPKRALTRTKAGKATESSLPDGCLMQELLTVAAKPGNPGFTHDVVMCFRILLKCQQYEEVQRRCIETNTSRELWWRHHFSFLLVSLHD